MHLVVGVVGDRAAGGDARSARAPRRPRSTLVDRVAVQIARRARPRRVLKPSASMRTTASKSSRGELAIRPGAPHQREQLVLVPLARGDLGDDLLRQHVERLLAGSRSAIELAAAHASSSAAHSTSSSRDSGNSRPFGMPPTAWPERPTRCRKRRDRARRAELADQVDVADVDAELERRGRDQRLQLAALQPLLGVEPLLLGEAAVVRGDLRPRRGARTAGARRARPCAAC